MKRLLITLSIGASTLGLMQGCGGDDGDGGNSQNSTTSGGSGGTGGKGSGGSVGPGTGGTGGTGGSGTSGSFDSQLPDSTTLGSLSDAQLQQICAESAAYWSDATRAATIKEFTCRFGGIFSASLSSPSTDAELQAACKTAYDQCIADPGKSDPAECKKPDATCTATVAEYEACMNEGSQMFDELLNLTPTCDTVTLESVNSGSDTQPPSPACDNFKKKCPQFNATPEPGAGTSGG